MPVVAPHQLAEQRLTAAQRIRELLADADPASDLPVDQRTHSRAQALQLVDAHHLKITRSGHVSNGGVSGRRSDKASPKARPSERRSS